MPVRTKTFDSVTVIFKENATIAYVTNNDESPKSVILQLSTMNASQAFGKVVAVEDSPFSKGTSLEIQQSGKRLSFQILKMNAAQIGEKLSSAGFTMPTPHS